MPRSLAKNPQSAAPAQTTATVVSAPKAPTSKSAAASAAVTQATPVNTAIPEAIRASVLDAIHKAGDEAAMANEDTAKRTLARFFTVKDPFDHPLFKQWAALVPNLAQETVLEPFSGANHIPATLVKHGWANEWAAFDIQPSKAKDNAMPSLKTKKRDTISDFPKGYNVAVTNPPWLAKNSAKRRGLPFPITAEDDLYKVALKALLDNVGHAAVLLPESFITQGIWRNRLFGVVSLADSPFEETEHPTCLALFLPVGTGDFDIWRGLVRVGSFADLASRLPSAMTDARAPWKFNVPAGVVGIRCVDNTRGPSIEFVRGETIPTSKIKHSSRSLTRIGGLPDNIDLDAFLAAAQARLDGWRNLTQDTLLTAFKGTRSDGHHRRRLDFANARMILDLALGDVSKSKKSKTAA